LKGSARSIKGLHIRDALDAIASQNPGLIEKFGGHAMAAGLTLAEDKFDIFAKAFDLEARRWLQEEDLAPVIWSDGPIGEDFTVELARELAQCSPWGQGFPDPMFDDEFEILDQRIVGGSHLKLKLAKVENGQVVDAIAFNQGQLLEDRYQTLAYRTDVNEFRGMVTVQLIVEPK
jgi:single-stranded-DNA-specific exonuclease